MMDEPVADIPYSRAAINDLEDFLRDIPSPTENLIERWSQLLDEPVSNVDESSLDKPPPTGTDSPEIKILEDPQPMTQELDAQTEKSERHTTTKRKAPGEAPSSKRKTKRTNATSKKLVLEFNANDLLSYFMTSSKGNPKRAKIGDDEINLRSNVAQASGKQAAKPESRQKREFTVSMKPDLEQENERLLKENQQLQEDLALESDRIADAYDRIKALRSTLCYDSKLAPFFDAAKEKGIPACNVLEPTADIRIPTVAITSIEQRFTKDGLVVQSMKQVIQRTDTPGSESSVASSFEHDHTYDESEAVVPENESGGVCVHLIGQEV